MSHHQDDKFKFRAPEENRHKYEPKKWESQTFQGVSPTDFYVRQNRQKKQVKEQEAQQAAVMYNYKAKGLSDEEIHARKLQKQKEEANQLKKKQVENAKHFNMPAASFELEKRKVEFERNKKWTETKRGQANKNADFDMARVFYAGGMGE